MRWFHVLLLLPLASCATRARSSPPAAPSRVQVRFVAQNDSFTAAVREYEQLWQQEGARIIEMMEGVSGLTFVTAEYADTLITANVLEASSFSGFRASPMRMRASYSPDTKRATLVHELGHRLQANLFRREEESHPPLFLWIYDVWVALWGPRFADEQVIVERRRGGPYPAAWDSALALTREQRAARWRAIRAARTSFDL